MKRMEVTINFKQKFTFDAQDYTNKEYYISFKTKSEIKKRINEHITLRLLGAIDSICNNIKEDNNIEDILIKEGFIQEI